MLTSTTTAIVNSVNSYERKSPRPSISSIRSNSNRRTSSARYNLSPRESCTPDQISGLSKTVVRRQETFQRILNNEPAKKYSLPISPPMLRHDFQCRKSIYATMFAVFLVSSILFVMMYLRCYDSYIHLAHKQGLSYLMILLRIES